jgi:hypothetical protein
MTYFPPVVPPVAIYSGDDCVFPAYQFNSGATFMDLSAWTLTAQWRAERDSGVVVQLSVDDTDSDTGRILVSATGLQTASMGSGGYWDLQGVDGSEVQTFIQGVTVYSLDVSR